ncbi:hypothetical protein BKA56DRAFT_492836 [Ilyonectria sp. MPI-CAGE-AT-0026]|nr:hypothetical protein BKA56DRAFT_492836 [Ilyonectria sp. MPI-CAGE-AT-0026]
MHASTFSYNISRPYPFVWFTPVVVVGGLVAGALTAFLSVATQGYEMSTVYSPNPNSTNPDGNVFAHWPSFLTANTKTLCSSTTIPVGTDFYTNNTALQYKLSSIWQGDNGMNPQSLFGSLPYHNNQLENCSVGAMTITFEGLDRSALQIAEQQWGADLTALVNCGVATPDGVMNVNLTTTYNFNPTERWFGVNSARFPGRNKTTKASLWWGESLLAWYSIALTDDMNVANGKLEQELKPVFKGYATFVRNGTSKPLGSEIKSLEFFNAGCFFVPFSDNGIESPVYFCHRDGMGNFDLIDNLVHAGDSDANAPLPGIWISADSLAKAFYFTVLADLGQTTPGPNILADPGLLEFFSRNITDIKTKSMAWGDNLGLRDIADLATSPFKESSNSSLGINSSVIAASYLCQVPRLKSAPSLAVSVLVNSFVLLSALWTFYKWCTDSLLARRHPELANSCEGCLARLSDKASQSYDSLQKPYGDGHSRSVSYIDETSGDAHFNSLPRNGYHAVQQVD